MVDLGPEHIIERAVPLSRKMELLHIIEVVIVAILWACQYYSLYGTILLLVDLDRVCVC